MTRPRPTLPVSTITPREIALLVALGVALRIVWMSLVHALVDPVDLGEATNATLAFARTGVVADAYFQGQGPTAHLMPTMIVIAGTIERLLGPDDIAANLTLAAWALIQVAAGFVLTIALFRRLGSGRPVLVGGLAALCVLPTCIAQEAADFRIWEGALAFDLAAATLLWAMTLSERATIRTRDLAIGAAGCALCFFVSPPAGLAVVAAWAVFGASRLRFRQLARWALMTVLACAMLIGPWAARNHALLGETVLLRSNFGLELAIANHQGALDPPSPRAALTARMEAVHQTKARFIAAGGEIAYSRAVGRETWRWIAAHPADFARLSLRHYRQFYIPDTWEERSTNWTGLLRFRIVALQVIGALGLIGIGIGLARRYPHYRMLAVYVAVAGLPYAVVQPIPRYGYLVYPLLVLLATRALVDLAALASAWARTTRSRASAASRLTA